ncbi:MAG: DUF3943 domain-containing protein [Myxococcales bacterium]
MDTRSWAYTVLPGLLVACASARPSGSESSTIEHMQSTKVIRLGYRDSAVPFSYLGPDGNPAGYSVDLCTRVVDGLRTDLQMPELRAQWVKVTADTRINAVVDGAIDLECGTTTATLARQERVDFSNLIFVDGTSLLSRIDAGVRTLPQLAGKRIAVIPGTTTEHVLYDAFKKAGVNVEVVNVNYSRDGLLAIDQQRVEAYAGDRAVLVNLALTSERPDRYAIIDEWLSYEPYGLMLRRDPDFRLAVNRQLARIYRSGAILEVYRTWFGKLGRPGNLLASMYELYSLPEANTTSTPSGVLPASGIAASTAPGQGAAGAVPASATTGPQASPAAFGAVPATAVPATTVGARGATMADPRSTAVNLPGLAATTFGYAPNRYRNPSPYSNPVFDTGPGGTHDKAYLLALGEVVAIDVAIWGYNYAKGAPFAQINGQTINDNFHKGWIIDTDDFWANSLLHPVHGTLTFNASRSLGLNFYESFAYAFFGSYLWEQFAEIQPPSLNDMVNTPFGGTLFGEALFRMSRLILDGNGYAPGFWRKFFAFVLTPTAGINRAMFGNKYRGELILPDSWLGEFRFGAALAGSNASGIASTNTTSIGPWGSISAKLVYNVPGTPGMVLEKPFDHFDFDASLAIGSSASNQPSASLRIRGLLAGNTISLGGEPGGLWGLFTSYDFIAPEVFRVQGFGLGPGISLAKRWGWFEQHATFVTEILPWAGGGTTQALGVRDYHYGPGANAVLELRSHITDHWTIRLEGRQYWISGMYSSGQSENISFARAGTTVRVYKSHGVSAVYDFSYRQARYPFQPEIWNRASLFSVYYTILQGW